MGREQKDGMIETAVKYWGAKLTPKTGAQKEAEKAEAYKAKEAEKAKAAKPKTEDTTTDRIAGALKNRGGVEE